MHRKSFTMAYVLLFGLVGCTTAPTREDAQKLLDSLTPDHFYSTATVKDSSVDTIATITTENGYQEKRGILNIVWDDSFLRGFIDKRTGKITIQFYEYIAYQGSSWRFYETVNYETREGPKMVPLTVIGRDVVDCSGSSYGGCTYAEHVTFELSEPYLRRLAASYKPGELTVWKLRFNAKSGAEFNAWMSPAEVQGFLRRLDEYRASAILQPHAS
jgi:hypothetical protein